ncbi:MAG: hypothetical protein QM757_43070 [Paludibaculum sp.]
MDSTGILENLAGLLTQLPDESVEGLLFAFDSATSGLDATQRASAAQLLLSAAGNCSDAARRDRLARAAEALAGGGAAGSAANIPDAARGVAQEEWDEKWAPTFLPPPEAGPDENDEEQEDYELEDLDLEEEDEPEEDAGEEDDQEDDEEDEED